MARTRDVKTKYKASMAANVTIKSTQEQKNVGLMNTL